MNELDYAINRIQEAVSEAMLKNRKIKEIETYATLKDGTQYIISIKKMQE